MRRLVSGCMLALACTAAPAFAQGDNTLVMGTKATFDMIANNFVRAAEKVPAEQYEFRPTPEVRTFGQIVAHVADGNYLICGAAGEKSSKGMGEVEKTAKTKEQILAALEESIQFCEMRFKALDDKSATEKVKLFSWEWPKLTYLSFNVAHMYEHYGNLATYMRMKGLVPPSSERQGSAN